MIDIVRLTVPGVFTLPVLRNFLVRAAEKMGYPNPGPTIDFVAWECQHPGSQVLLGFEDDAPKAFTVTLLPGSPLMVEPQLVSAYNEGSVELSKSMLREVAAFIRAAGHRKFMFTNRTGHSDEVQFRYWRDIAEGHVYGHSLEFELKE